MYVESNMYRQMAMFLIPVYMWPQRSALHGCFLLWCKILAIGTWTTFLAIFADISVVHAQKMLSFLPSV